MTDPLQELKDWLEQRHVAVGEYNAAVANGLPNRARRLNRIIEAYDRKIQERGGDATTARS